MAIKQNQPQPEVKRQLGRKQEKKHSQEYFDLHSCVELLDVKSIIDNRQAYIQLVDNKGNAATNNITVKVPTGWSLNGTLNGTLTIATTVVRHCWCDGANKNWVIR